MYVTRGDWQKFQQYLYLEKGLSRNLSSHYSNHSRFRIICRYFHNQEWTRENFRGLIGHLETKGCKDSTLNKIITMGRYIDNFLGLQETATFKYRKEKPNKIEDLLTPEEIKRIAEVEIPYAKFHKYINHRQKALIMLMGTTGCRISEALNLTWDYVYAIPIPHIVFLETKNGDDREVPLGIDVYNLIKALPKKSKWVFDSGRGRNLSPQDCNSDIKRRARACNVTKRVYNHLFRHSFISTMLEQSTSESDVMKIVGHKDYKSLMRYKNSHLSYYAGVIQFHPLLIHNVSWKEKINKLEFEIKKLFDVPNHTIELSHKVNQMKIIVRQVQSD